MLAHMVVVVATFLFLFFLLLNEQAEQIERLRTYLGTAQYDR